MKAIKGPGIFLSQFIGENEPFNSLEGLAKWASSLGFKGLQIPCNHKHIFDVSKAATSKEYCDEVKGLLNDYNLEVTELSTHLEGQLLAVHPAYDAAFDGFAPVEYRNNPKARKEYAQKTLMQAAHASKNLGLKAHATFSGAFAWPYFFPWPPHNQELLELAFDELAKRWLPVLNAFDEADCDVCFELHPGEDLHDGITFERFLAKVNNHKRANVLFDPSHMLLQNMDYLGFIKDYHERIKAFHVKDAEFVKDSKSGVYGGYQSWINRPGHFRSPGDGQIDFKAIFSLLTKYGYDGWAVLEWECCLKNSEDGAREGAKFIKEHLIKPTEHSFDDFAATNQNIDEIKKILGI